MALSIFFGNSVIWLAISPFMAAIGALIVGAVVLQHKPGQPIDPTRWKGLAALIALAVFLAAITQAAEIASGGYLDHRVQLIRKSTVIDATPNERGAHAKSQKDVAQSGRPDTCDNFVVWIGDKAMVLDCDLAHPMSRLKLVYGSHDFEANLDRRLRDRTFFTSTPRPSH